MVNFRSPMTLLLLTIGVVAIGLLIALGAGVKLDFSFGIAALIILGLLALVWWIFRNEGKKEDLMPKAKEYLRTYIDKHYDQQKVMHIGFYGEKKYFGKNVDPFFGFLFRRSAGHRQGIPMNIVMQHTGGNFHICKEKEISDDEYNTWDPFVALKSGFMGSPVPESQPEDYLVYDRKRGELVKLDVNVGNKKDEDNFKPPENTKK